MRCVVYKTKVSDWSGKTKHRWNVMHLFLQKFNKKCFSLLKMFYGAVTVAEPLGGARVPRMQLYWFGSMAPNP